MEKHYEEGTQNCELFFSNISQVPYPKNLNASHFQRKKDPNNHQTSNPMVTKYTGEELERLEQISKKSVSNCMKAIRCLEKLLRCFPIIGKFISNVVEQHHIKKVNISFTSECFMIDEYLQLWKQFILVITIPVKNSYSKIKSIISRLHRNHPQKVLMLQLIRDCFSIRLEIQKNDIQQCSIPTKNTLSCGAFSAKYRLPGTLQDAIFHSCSHMIIDLHGQNDGLHTYKSSPSVSFFSLPTPTPLPSISTNQSSQTSNIKIPKDYSEIKSTLYDVFFHNGEKRDLNHFLSSKFSLHNTHLNSEQVLEFIHSLSSFLHYQRKIYGDNILLESAGDHHVGMNSIYYLSPEKIISFLQKGVSLFIVSCDIENIHMQKSKFFKDSAASLVKDCWNSLEILYEISPQSCHKVIQGLSINILTNLCSFSEDFKLHNAGIVHFTCVEILLHYCQNGLICEESENNHASMFLQSAGYGLTLTNDKNNLVYKAIPNHIVYEIIAEVSFKLLDFISAYQDIDRIESLLSSRFSLHIRKFMNIIQYFATLGNIAQADFINIFLDRLVKLNKIDSTLIWSTIFCCYVKNSGFSFELWMFRHLRDSTIQSQGSHEINYQILRCLLSRLVYMPKYHLKNHVLRMMLEVRKQLLLNQEKRFHDVISDIIDQCGRILSNTSCENGQMMPNTTSKIGLLNEYQENGKSALIKSLETLIHSDGGISKLQRYMVQARELLPNLKVQDISQRSKIYQFFNFLFYYYVDEKKGNSNQHRHLKQILEKHFSLTPPPMKDILLTLGIETKTPIIEEFSLSLHRFNELEFEQVIKDVLNSYNIIDTNQLLKDWIKALLNLNQGSVHPSNVMEGIAEHHIDVLRCMTQILRRYSNFFIPDSVISHYTSIIMSASGIKENIEGISWKLFSITELIVALNTGNTLILNWKEIFNITVCSLIYPENAIAELVRYLLEKQIETLQSDSDWKAMLSSCSLVLQRISWIQYTIECNSPFMDWIKCNHCLRKIHTKIDHSLISSEENNTNSNNTWIEQSQSLHKGIIIPFESEYHILFPTFGQWLHWIAVTSTSGQPQEVHFRSAIYNETIFNIFIPYQYKNNYANFMKSCIVNFVDMKLKNPNYNFDSNTLIPIISQCSMYIQSSRNHQTVPYALNGDTSNSNMELQMENDRLWLMNALLELKPLLEKRDFTVEDIKNPLFAIFSLLENINEILPIHCEKDIHQVVEKSLMNILYKSEGDISLSIIGSVLVECSSFLSILFRWAFFADSIAAAKILINSIQRRYKNLNLILDHEKFKNLLPEIHQWIILQSKNLK